ncbi:MAG: hypothetical protein QM676_02050 [Novosphingobium sp.]
MARLAILTLGAVLAAGLAAPALAAHEPTTRVVSCRAGSCLQVSGHRHSAAAAVLINGHAVAVEGERKWRAELPVETVRAWSEPFARTIEVATFDPATQRNTAMEADLPIGLLGGVTNLASLVVSMK